jgi:hypothetical protein
MYPVVEGCRRFSDEANGVQVLALLWEFPVAGRWLSASRSEVGLSILCLDCVGFALLWTCSRLQVGGSLYSLVHGIAFPLTVGQPFLVNETPYRVLFGTLWLSQRSLEWWLLR